eukprot:4095088-Amphidinium_carterae.1
MEEDRAPPDLSARYSRILRRVSSDNLPGFSSDIRAILSSSCCPFLCPRACDCLSSDELLERLRLR